MVKRVSLSGTTYVDWRGRLFAIGTGLTLGLALVEILGRAIHYLPSPPSNSYLDLTNSIGPLPEPLSGRNYTFGGGFSQWLEFNALGFRGAMIDFPTNDHRQRVLVLGDSYTAAWQVPLQDRWTEKMQQIHPGWVILNLGMPNWGTDQEYLTLLNYPLRQPPDLVLLMFYPGNDVSDNARLELTGNPPNHPYFVPDGIGSDGNLSLHEVPWHFDNPFDRPRRLPFPTNVRSWLYLNSVSYHLASDLKTSLSKDDEAHVMPLLGTTDPHPVPLEAGVYRTLETPEWTLAWKVTEALLLRMKSAAENWGARFVIVVVPPYGLVQPELRPE